MAIYQVKTFQDICRSVLEELKVQHSDDLTTGDLKAINRIKRLVNRVYMNEVVPYEEWKWLYDNIDITHQAKITTGTATVASFNTTVTLTTAPAYSVRGYYFKVSGYSEKYRIAQHTANSTTLVLESQYTGTSNSAAGYEIWTDAVLMPSTCRDTLEIHHDFQSQPLTGHGLQKFRKMAALCPDLEGRPSFYTTTDWIDPVPYAEVTDIPNPSFRSSDGFVKSLVFNSDVSSYVEIGDWIEVADSGQFQYNGRYVISNITTTNNTNDTIQYSTPDNFYESGASDSFRAWVITSERVVERQRQILIHPAKSTKKTTLHIDFIRMVVPLENNDDEPLMPIEDRDVLVYGTLMHAWRSIGRNKEEADTNASLYDRKLSKMQGKLDDTTDFPQLVVSRGYLKSKRRSSGRYGGFDAIEWGGSDSGGSEVITGTANTVAVFNSSGELVSSPTISTDELSYLNNVIAETDTTLLDNQASVVAITTFAAASLNDVIIEYNISRGTGNYQEGSIHIVTDETTVSWSHEVSVSSGTVGITFDVDISSGTVTWGYTSTSTGTSAALEYRMRRQ